MLLQSPDGSKRVYKKEIYSYKTSGSGPTSEKSRMQNSINQLDTLLDDLKQVKNGQLIEKGRTLFYCSDMLYAF